MQGHFLHLFLAQFFMLFHMVALLFLSIVAFLTILLLAENLQLPIRVFEIGGYWSCHGEQNASYHVKEDKNLYQKIVSKVTLHFVGGHLSRKQTVTVLPELNRYKDTIRCDRLGAKVPGHRQQQLMQTLIMRLLKTHFFGDLFFVVSKIAQQKPTKLHRWQYLGQVLDDEVTVGDLFTV